MPLAVGIVGLTDLLSMTDLNIWHSWSHIVKCQGKRDLIVTPFKWEPRNQEVALSSVTFRQPACLSNYRLRCRLPPTFV